MSQLVQTRLVNDVFSDPGLFIDFRFGRRAILFDLGDNTPLVARELLRVTDVFVSHLHMDHFSGFDRLLRTQLYRPGSLRIIGPKGLVDGVRSKLDAYLWNLLDDTSADFRIAAAEFHDGRLGRWTEFRARDAFRARPLEAPLPPPGVLLAEDDFRIDCEILDHGTDSLAFALQESLRVNVWRQELDRMGLSVGPWLNVAKAAVRRTAPDDVLIDTDDGRKIAVGELKQACLRTAPGQRIAYVTDAVFSEENARRIERLARGAGHLYIEAAFLDADEEIAAARKHLTAGQAGRLARAAGARRMSVFHHSPRYLENPEAPPREAASAFQGVR